MYVKSLGRLFIPIKQTVQLAPFIVVDRQRASFEGRNIQPKIGIKLQQEQTKYQMTLHIVESPYLCNGQGGSIHFNARSTICVRTNASG